MFDAYRARDVYYELARLFPGTEWQDLATARLRHIMAAGTTTEKEETSIANVFFGLDEDMNAKARELLSSPATAEDEDAD